MADSILDVSDVRKSYGTTEALRGVSLAVESGELFGLLGPNGAGKTTLLSIVAGLASTDAGYVRLFGKLLSPSDLALKPLIGLATQDLAIYGEMSARENLAFFGRLYGMRGTELAKRVEEILDFTALTEKADQRAGTYSGGMKRRLNLGLAVLHRPKIVFLDEPTTGVDPQSRNHIFEKVRQLNSEGTTLVYTSHYMEEVQALCPRIAIIDHGQVIACDSRTNLLRRLPGTLSLSVSERANEASARLSELDGVEVMSVHGSAIRLAAGSANECVVQAIRILRELGIELTGMEAKEPTLEEVFLQLTDLAVRD